LQILDRIQLVLAKHYFFVGFAVFSFNSITGDFAQEFRLSRDRAGTGGLGDHFGSHLFLEPFDILRIQGQREGRGKISGNLGIFLPLELNRTGNFRGNIAYFSRAGIVIDIGDCRSYQGVEISAPDAHAGGMGFHGKVRFLFLE
jgi:hypothetical protein